MGGKRVKLTEHTLLYRKKGQQGSRIIEAGKNGVITREAAWPTDSPPTVSHRPLCFRVIITTLLKTVAMCCPYHTDSEIVCAAGRGGGTFPKREATYSCESFTWRTMSWMGNCQDKLSLIKTPGSDVKVNVGGWICQFLAAVTSGQAVSIIK